MRRFRGNLGFTLLAVWLILTGLVSLINFNFTYLPQILAVLALAAGVLILLRR
jgi:hypothetical protein